MLYHLLYPLAETFGGFNVVRYITFRTAAATLTALFISFVMGPWLIRKLSALRVGQPIREIGPDHQAKAGTPTMGGLLILLSLIVSVLLWAQLDNRFVWIVLGLTTGNVGIIRVANDALVRTRPTSSSGSSPVRPGTPTDTPTAGTPSMTDSPSTIPSTQIGAVNKGPGVPGSPVGRSALDFPLGYELIPTGSDIKGFVPKRVAARGSFVVVRLDRDGRQVPITRREVAELHDERVAAATCGGVTDRVFAEDMRNEESRLDFDAMGFNILNM